MAGALKALVRARNALVQAKLGRTAGVKFRLGQPRLR